MGSSRVRGPDNPVERNPGAVRDGQSDPEHAVELQCRTDPGAISLRLGAARHSAEGKLDLEGRRLLDLLRWGLIPFWAKDATIGARCIDAMAETVAAMPAFREAFRRGPRCPLPVDRFCE
jgi:putative SOS response-associated peptidase YedK